jgi:hypothetical protein
VNEGQDMKTTIEIADDLFLRAKASAEEEGVTLRSLTEEGLRRVIEEHGQRRRTKLEPVTVGGNGIRSEWRDASWPQIRDLTYGDRS